MAHLTDGTLRRIYDEPLAISGADQGHLDACPLCRERAGLIANDTRALEWLLSVHELPLGVAASFTRLQARIRTDEAARPVRWYERWTEPALHRWPDGARVATAILLAAALVVGFTASGFAQKLITVFHPTQVVGVQVSRSDLRAAGTPLDYGTLAWNPAPPLVRQVPDLTTAVKQSGLSALNPSSVPAAAGSTVSYAVIDRATASFAFDAGKLRASAARTGQHVADMPAAINGSILYVASGPSLIEVYGPLPVVGAEPGASAQAEATAAALSLPRLVIAETRAPTVTSTGATAKELQDYLLSQPGVPPDIAAQLRAIKDPTSTLPIPIPSNLATSQPVQVQGVQGLLVDAGIAAGVIWQKGGIIYAVLGQLTPDQILQVANSLH
jgi:hypothetical protein